jgi:hypothetical protein
LPDSGAAHWAATLRKIREINPGITIEALVPDFRGNPEHLDQVISVRPNILSHNVETVRRLTPLVRSVARYDTSLAALKQIADAGILAKSGLMLGLGENESEVIETLHDLRTAGCRLLSIGQYLQPSRKNIPVSAYISPGTFELYREKALSMQFSHVESGPLVRSSYHSWLPVVNETGTVQGKVEMSIGLSGNQYLLPVVRVAFLHKEKFLLKPSAATRQFDYPYERYLRFGESLEKGLHETFMQNGGTGELPARFVLRYIHRKTNRLIYLYICNITDESVLQDTHLKEGKWWTSQQIEDNLDAGIFSPYFEEEFEFLNATVLTATRIMNDL